MESRARGDVWRLATASAASNTGNWAVPLSGMMADRLDRKHIMITCDLLGAMVYAGMAAASRPLLCFLFACSDSFAFVGFNGIYQRDTPDAIRAGA